MNTINANTKIAQLLKQNPDALEAIISISPKFTKLRNPLLRKIMASRTSIGTACKIGACAVEDFFIKLKPLGFAIDATVEVENETVKAKPAFMHALQESQMVELDVRAMLDAGNDPFQLILGKVNGLATSQVLKLINTFDPIPLIQILEKKGFETYSDVLHSDLVHTYFHKTKAADIQVEASTSSGEEWDKALAKYAHHLKEVEVRHLEMPLPMLTILDELEQLKKGDALYVFHKRIPVFLLPELQERKMEYLIKEISDAEVHLLIFHS